MKMPDNVETQATRGEYYVYWKAETGALKLFPVWDPLRGDSRFEQIVSSLAPK